jgi:hypothetical protein
VQEPQPLGTELVVHCARAGDIAARMDEARDDVINPSNTNLRCLECTSGQLLVNLVCERFGIGYRACQVGMPPADAQNHPLRDTSRMPARVVAADDRTSRRKDPP